MLTNVPILIVKKNISEFPMNNMLSREEIDALKEIYLYSNTPLFLYDNFRQNEAVRTLSQKQVQELANEFRRVGLGGVETLHDLVYAYALYVALTFKSYEEVASFFNGDGNIKFEWFRDVREIYFSRNRPTMKESLDLGSIKFKPPYSINQSGSQVSDFIEEVQL